MTAGDVKVIRFRCPHCGAQPWMHCRQPSGKIWYFHAKRHRLAFP
jgi:hypothetical protein